MRMDFSAFEHLLSITENVMKKDTIELCVGAMELRSELSMSMTQVA